MRKPLEDLLNCPFCDGAVEPRIETGRRGSITFDKVYHPSRQRRCFLDGQSIERRNWNCRSSEDVLRQEMEKWDAMWNNKCKRLQVRIDELNARLVLIGDRDGS